MNRTGTQAPRRHEIHHRPDEVASSRLPEKPTTQPPRLQATDDPQGAAPSLALPLPRQASCGYRDGGGESRCSSSGAKKKGRKRAKDADEETRSCSRRRNGVLVAAVGALTQGTLPFPESGLRWTGPFSRRAANRRFVVGPSQSRFCGPSLSYSRIESNSARSSELEGRLLRMTLANAPWCSSPRSPTDWAATLLKPYSRRLYGKVC